jgi:cytochrome c oxidase assembly protein subunit 15
MKRSADHAAACRRPAFRKPGCRRKYGTLLIFVLLAQVTLGILNVILFLPLPVAVAHNATGALLLATMLRLLFLSRATER